MDFDMNVIEFAKKSVFAIMRQDYDKACVERFANEEWNPGHQFTYTQKLLGRRVLSKLFGKKAKRPARECEAMELFLHDFLGLCGYTMAGTPSLMGFMEDMNLKPQDLEYLWVECGRRGPEFWPLVERTGENTWRLGWSEAGKPPTTWQKYTRTLDLLDTTGIFE